MIMAFDRVCRNRFSCAAGCDTPAPIGTTFAARESRTKSPDLLIAVARAIRLVGFFDRETIVAPNAICRIIDPIIDLGPTDRNILEGTIRHHLQSLIILAGQECLFQSHYLAMDVCDWRQTSCSFEKQAGRSLQR